MKLYEKSTADLMRDYLREHSEQIVYRPDEIVAWFKAKYPNLQSSTVKIHIGRMTTNYTARLHYKPKHPADDLFFRESNGILRKFDPAKDPKPIMTERDRDSVLEAGPLPPTDDADDDGAGLQFAQETHLRDFLQKNLERLESGLRIYTNEDGFPGVEFPIRNRRIDLLCEGKDGAFVVVELKLSRGAYSAVGQILTYMSWVRADLASGRAVRGILVAREMTDEVKAAVQESRAEIALFEYELDFKVKRAAPA